MNRAFLATLLAGIALSGCICNVPSNGEKVGQIVKVEETGVVCKTFEAELIRGGLTGGSGVAGGAPLHFTVRGDLVGEAQEAMKTNAEVVVKYDRALVANRCLTASDGYFAKEINAARPVGAAVAKGAE